VPAVDYEKRTETPIIGLLATLEEVANDEAKLAELRTLAEEFKRIGVADLKRQQFQRFLEQFKTVTRPASVREYLRGMFEKHVGTINDVFDADDPLPALGALYPLALMLKHGKLSTAMLVSEQELSAERAGKRLRDYLRPNWSTLLLTGVLFVLSVAIDHFEFPTAWLGQLLGWPRHAAEAVAGREAGGGAAYAFYHLLNFVYLYVLGAIILWLRRRWRRT
jgi:hypothetical protein